MPWRYIGDRVDARSTATMVQIFHHGQLIKTHPRKDRGKQTDLGDYPPEKIAFQMRTPTWCRRQAAEIGPACVGGDRRAARRERAVPAARRPRRARAGRQAHPARLEAACAKATAVGDPSYRTIKGILAAGTETAPAPRPAGDGGAAAHLHGPAQLFAEPDGVLGATVIPLPTVAGPAVADMSTTTSTPATTAATVTALSCSQDAS